MVMHKLKNTLARFSKDEDGLALTEYLVLLGLLTGTLILAVVAFGGALNTQWAAWTAWISGELTPPALSGGGGTTGTGTGTTN